MGLFNIIANFKLNEQAAYLWALVLGSGLAIAANAIAAFLLFRAKTDWRNDYLYRPSLPMMINVGLLISRCFYLYSVEIIMTREIDAVRCRRSLSVSCARTR